MKIIKNFLPIVLALFPQLIFDNYTYIVLFTISVGFVGGWFLKDEKVFLKIVLFQLVFFSILFYTACENIFYLNNVIQNLGLPSFVIPLIFILFNTLNISILFLFGYRIKKLVFNNSNF